MVYVLGLLSLLFMVVAHEFGHFIMAKSFGVYVNEFAVGMGPVLLSKKAKSGTVYSIRAFPLGGFCAMKGESDDNTHDADSFTNAGVLQRIAIVAAGPLFNLILAYVLCWCIVAGAGSDVPVVELLNEKVVATSTVQPGDKILALNGLPITTTRKAVLYDTMFRGLDGLSSIPILLERDGKQMTVMYDLPFEDKYMFGFSHSENEDGQAYVVSFLDDSPLREAGVKQGDIIVAVDGVRFTKNKTFIDVFDENHPVENKAYEMMVLHDGEEKTVVVTPSFQRNYWLGIGFSPERIPVNVWRGVWGELDYSVFVVTESLKQIFTGKVGVDSLSGPVAVVSAIGDSYSEITDASSDAKGSALVSLLGFLAMISVNLGLLNLLPIPALDGGRLVFLFIELIRRKPVKPSIEMAIHRYGLIVLMIFSIGIITKDMVPIWKKLLSSFGA